MLNISPVVQDHVVQRPRSHFMRLEHISVVAKKKEVLNKSLKLHLQSP